MVSLRSGPLRQPLVCRLAEQAHAPIPSSRPAYSALPVTVSTGSAPTSRIRSSASSARWPVP